MRRLSFRPVMASALLCFVAATTALAQDFQQSYRIGAGGSVSIRNVSGDVTVTGYDGDAITVNGFKEGADRDQVTVEDLSGSDRVDLRVRYPRNCNCDASIRFEVRVPRSVRYRFDRLSTASGNITVSAVTGQININTASGDVLVKDVSGTIHANTASGEMRVQDVSGAVSANSASGDVEVEIARLEGSDDMKFSTASGDVSVRLPTNLDATVSMSSMSGSIKTNFPIEVKQREYGPGSTASGRLGNGSRSLRISSASGDVSLMGR
jgi:DUF4097 and DUF4098 domain-containing protein YvlB